MYNIVLYQPEIPHNTGAIGRLALATGATLHLVKPLGFSIDDTAVKRAGLDYWKDVDVKVWEDWTTFEQSVEALAGTCYFLTTKTEKTIYGTEFKKRDYLVFGPESRGLPESILEKNPDTCLTIPMLSESTRSLNLATSVSIVLYEGVRQVNFK
ncbi:tRNA (cytidine(34)-2'-O)-methyltransferase [Akkermansiaceae bacterium]|nr:tRNA (cytidine(34)-2'-O)-methyltransferase [Akkermansiaceae bacterium]